MVAQVQTYTGLATAIIQWANRNDDLFISNVPLFISIAEQEVFIDFSTIGNEVYISGNFIPNNQILPKPGNWGKTAKFFYIDSDNQVKFLFRQNVGTAIYENADLEATNMPDPRYYSDYGFPYWIVVPAPTVAFPFYISYFAKVDPLSSSNQSNWTSLNAYDLLFWNSMHKACVFINSVDWANYYKGLYTTAVAQYNAYDKDRLQDASVNPEFE